MNCEERCEDRHASACLVCGDGGDLLCCDACPNAVHPTCVSLETVPEVRQARTSCSYGTDLEAVLSVHPSMLSCVML